MGGSKSNSQREVQRIQAFFKKQKEKSQANYHLKIRKKWTNKTQSQQEEGNNKDKGGNKYNRGWKQKGNLRSPRTKQEKSWQEEAQWSSA